MTLTNQPQGGRGCGSRKAGCAYGSMGTGSDGIPIWDFVLDPPIRWLGDHKFRGVRPSPDWLITAILEYAEINEILADVLQYESGKEDHWIENNIVLVDMIGIGKSLGTGYPTAPSFVEEVRRFGMSRRLDGIDWSSLAGRKPWLVPIHWRALATLREGYAEVDYRNCHGSLTSEYEGKTYHYPDCLYHLWPLSTHFHETSGGKWHGDN